MNITSFWDLFRATFAGLQATGSTTFPSLIGSTSQSQGSPLLSAANVLPTLAATSLASPLQQTIQQRTKLGSIGLVPSLIGGLLGRVFGGEDDPEPVSTQPFSLPSAINLETGFSKRSGKTGPIDYSANSQPRVIDQQQPAGGSPSVVIQIQALDSRSILDRSQEIASAVREAVLNAHPLGALLRE